MSKDEGGDERRGTEKRLTTTVHLYGEITGSELSLRRDVDLQRALCRGSPVEGPIPFEEVTFDKIYGNGFRASPKLLVEQTFDEVQYETASVTFIGSSRYDDELKEAIAGTGNALLFSEIESRSVWPCQVSAFQEEYEEEPRLDVLIFLPLEDFERMKDRLRLSRRLSISLDLTDTEKGDWPEEGSFTFKEMTDYYGHCSKLTIFDLPPHRPVTEGDLQKLARSLAPEIAARANRLMLTLGFVVVAGVILSVML